MGAGEKSGKISSWTNWITDRATSIMTGKQVPRKHTPLRTCVVCRQKTAKRQLIRLVRTAEEGLVVDPTGKRNGRGAYLCSNSDCWERALTTPVLERALGAPLSATDRKIVASHKPQAQVAANVTSGNME